MDRAVRHRGWPAIAIVAAVLLGGCTTGSSATSGPADTSPSGSAPASGGTTGGAGAGAGGAGAASIDACSLLTPAEIQQVLGVTVDGGLLQKTDSQANCDWNGQDQETSLGVSVQNYDSDLWTTESSAQAAIPVNGIGEKAYKGWPRQADLSIKQGAYEIDVGVVDFKMTNEQSDAAALALAKLVLSRVGGG